jgi:hypothetical protein
MPRKDSIVVLAVKHRREAYRKHLRPRTLRFQVYSSALDSSSASILSAIC